MPAFTREKLIERSPLTNTATGKNSYKFTNLGLIPVGALPLAQFNPLHELQIGQKLAYLEAAIFDNSGAVLPYKELQVRLTDLRIYCAQMRKVLLSNLYYLKIQADGQVFYKIGEPLALCPSDLQRFIETCDLSLTR